MKRIMCLVVIAALAALPALASVRLLNLGYNIWTAGEAGFSMQSVGLVYTCKTGDTAGFYMQVTPHLPLRITSGPSVYDLLESGERGGGLMLTLGAGTDVRLAGFGVVVGGGLLVNAVVLAIPGGYVFDGYDIWGNGAVGAGGGVHLYFQPRGGSFLVNFGVDAAWRPLVIQGYTSHYSPESSFQPRNWNININAGIGCRK